MKSTLCILIYILLCSVNSIAQKINKVPDYLPDLKTRQDFDLLKGEPLSNNFKGIECVKLVYRLKDKQIFYLESKKYKWHYRFTSEYLSDNDDLESFNDKNYSQSPKRKYILATFNYNVNTGNYFLQFASSDNPTDAQIDELVGKVTETFFLKKKFKILLNTTILLRRKKELAAKHDVFTSDELFKGQNYQPICKGKACGKLVFTHTDSLDPKLDYSNSLLILNGSSNSLPICKGLITNEFQTPLSHICLLTNNRKTPAAAVKNIILIDSLKKLSGMWVELEVGENEFKLQKKDSSGVLNSGSKKPKLYKPDTDNDFSKISDLSDFGYKNKNHFGSKAANLAELQELSKEANFKTPKKAFAIPFYYYDQHIKINKIDTLIAFVLKNNNILLNDTLLENYLLMIRERILNSPINTLLSDCLDSMCINRFGKNKVRFRSSSNCEDEANFNGAGLYTSETGIYGHAKKTYQRAVKRVWASLWNTRAFKERQFFNFDNGSVRMAVLVHEAFDNEIINGVAVTKNLYRDYEAGFVINMQPGEEEVVSPKPGVQCEQVVSYMNTYSDFYNANRSADWISFSSFHPEGSLLSQDELFELTKQLEIIKKHFYKVYKKFPETEYKDFGMDVEFKIISGSDGKHSILIKQARPFND